MSTMGSLPVAEFSLQLDLPLCTDHQCKLYRQGIVASAPSCWSAFRKAIGFAEVGVNMVSSGVWRTICESARDKFSDVALAPHAGQLYWLKAWEGETH